MELQELISRGRFILSVSPKRLETFRFINGKRSSKDIALKSGRSHSSALNDLKILTDMGLVRHKRDSEGNIIRKERCVVYEKVPLIRHVSISYFKDKVVKREKIGKKIKKNWNATVIYTLGKGNFRYM